MKTRILNEVAKDPFAHFCEGAHTVLRDTYLGYGRHAWLPLRIVGTFSRVARHRMEREQFALAFGPIYRAALKNLDLANEAIDISLIRGAIRNGLSSWHRCTPKQWAGAPSWDIPSFIERMKGKDLTPANFRYDRACGVELECYGFLPKDLPVWARAGVDGSLDGSFKGLPSVEYRVLLHRASLEVRLHRLCKLLVNHKVNQKCGLHIHLDMRARSESAVWVIAGKVDRWLRELAELVPQSRRDNSYAKFGISKTDRYRAVNYTAYREHQTLEIRLHSGTVDYEKIIAWIRLLELLVAMPKAPKAGCGFHTAFASLPLSDYERAFWLKRHQALNPALYASACPTVEVE